MKHLMPLLLAACAGHSYALDCDKASSTIEINQCALQEQQKVERQLNATYQETLKVFASADDASTKTKLVDAQRLWVKFREADCQAEYDKWKGGTIRNVMYSGCMQERAKQRIKELESFQARG
ncbi:uncharacterized protein YecT (DUF1311 family) [Duganella sp. 1224]|uniref:lysozyme inhibitor LprI family protein n=1 Tax=Duganella sp. 1224 TaxID=2587052 RepID=UPI0015C7B9A1|nr:lysozyme inhibitor LprI family protein [Duganella sp. 1224]NYE60833.1 uncharacterized protein YecT (DUF1311 family) [Duganella sp. 1224]